MSKRTYIRPLVQRLHAYVPGEQPRIRGLVKLNTNENPYPPSPRVLAAIKAAVDGRLRLYPNPAADGVREALARFHGCAPEQIIVGNGSDELLEMAVSAFVEPVAALAAGKGAGAERCRLRRSSPQTVQFFTPSYSLYPVLAAMHGACMNAVPLAHDFALPPLDFLRRSHLWDFTAALSIITTPNAPSGRSYAAGELDALCRAQRGVVLLDEAYADFAPAHAMELALRHPHVLVARTFSKGYSLCFLRIGYCVGHPRLIEALHKIRDSYNVNGLAQVAAVATLRDQAYYQRNFRRVIATRERLAKALADFGFVVLPSATNFLLVRPPAFPARRWLERLRERKILVRWFDQPRIDEFLRITVGTEAEAMALIRAVRSILKGRGANSAKMNKAR